MCCLRGIFGRPVQPHRGPPRDAHACAFRGYITTTIFDLNRRLRFEGGGGLVGVSFGPAAFQICSAQLEHQISLTNFDHSNKSFAGVQSFKWGFAHLAMAMAGFFQRKSQQTSPVFEFFFTAGTRTTVHYSAKEISWRGKNRSVVLNDNKPD